MRRSCLLTFALPRNAGQPTVEAEPERHYGGCGRLEGSCNHRYYLGDSPPRARKQTLDATTTRGRLRDADALVIRGERERDLTLVTGDIRGISSLIAHHACIASAWRCQTRSQAVSPAVSHPEPELPTLDSYISPGNVCMSPNFLPSPPGWWFDSCSKSLRLLAFDFGTPVARGPADPKFREPKGFASSPFL